MHSSVTTWILLQLEHCNCKLEFWFFPEGNQEAAVNAEEVSDNPEGKESDGADKKASESTEEVVLREEDVGIMGYISQLPGFNGVIKQR